MIAGTVNLPPGPGPLPFVVLNFGTSGCDRDCPMAGRPALACLAKPFVEAGIGVVPYDDRGRGQSVGDIATLDLQHANDAAAVAGLVAGRSDLDLGTLFLLGWSEGVAHASVAAARLAEGVGAQRGSPLGPCAHAASTGASPL